MLYHHLLLIISTTVVVLRCEGKVIAPQTKEKIANSQGESRMVSPTPDSKMIAPQTKEMIATSQGGSKMVAPPMDSKVIAPQTKEKIANSQGESRMVSPPMESKVIAPRTKERTASSQGESKMVAPTTRNNVSISISKGKHAFSKGDRKVIGKRKVVAAPRKGNTVVPQGKRKTVVSQRKRKIIYRRRVKTCVDKHDLCKFWTATGECENTTEYMVKNCAKSCGRCAGRDELMTEDLQWSAWSACSKSCGGGERDRERICPRISHSYVDAGLCPDTVIPLNPNELERGPFNPDEDDEMFPEPSPFNPDEDTVPFPQPSDPDEDPMPDELGPVPFSPDEEEMPFLEPAQLGPDELPSEMDAMILETEKCNTNPCAPAFIIRSLGRSSNWGSWGEFSRCSKSCGEGVKFRTRTCLLPDSHPMKCAGPSEEWDSCNDKPCVERGSKLCKPCRAWTAWSPFNTCSKSCGGGTKKRSRYCPVDDPDTCSGVEIKECNIEKCDESCKDMGDWCLKLANQGCCHEEEWIEYMKDCKKACGKCTVKPKAETKNGINRPYCGKPVNVRVVGGNDTEKGEWPWQVRLQHRFSSDAFCGGTLINKQWVLTAAHCFGTTTNVKFWSVTLGDHDLSVKDDGEIRVGIAKIVKHPDFNFPHRWNNDIALIKLARRVETSRSKVIKPVCIEDEWQAYNVGQKCFITGWGHTKHQGKNSDILQKAQVPVVPFQDCKETLVTIELTENMICAGKKIGGVDSCQNDSGGPLVCRRGEQYWQVGIVSFGIGCAAPDTYGVYTKVSNYNTWMHKTIEAERSLDELLD